MVLYTASDNTTIRMSNESNEKNEKKYFSLSMSKARYQQVAKIIGDALECDPDKIEPTLAKIRELFKFDLEKNSYNREYGTVQIERRKQMQQETGLSSYELFNKKYHKTSNNKSIHIC